MADRAIGNGIAHGFARGAAVRGWGRAQAADYDLDDGSDLAGFRWLGEETCRDLDAIEAAAAAVRSVRCADPVPGTVVYRRGEFEREGWDWVMAVNLDSLMHISRKFRPLAVAKRRIDRHRRSLISGLKANIGNPAYAASKAGAISLTKTLGQAFAADGIRVNGLAPGLTYQADHATTCSISDRLRGCSRIFRSDGWERPRTWRGRRSFLPRRLPPMSPVIR